MCKSCVWNIEDLYLKDPLLKTEDVAILQQWMCKEPHLPKISDFQMICFLSSCYYSIEATKVCIETYYTIRSNCPELFSGSDINEGSLKYHVDTIFTGALPKLTKDDYQIIYAKIQGAALNKFNFNDVVRVMVMKTALNTRLSGPQNGHILILDGADLQLSHVLKMNITTVKKYCYFVQEAMPIRLKALHILNVNAITERLIQLIKPFLKKELVENMHCHVKINTVYEFIPKDILPNDYGGTIGTIQQIHEEWIQKVKDHADMLAEDEQLKTDESKRSGIPKNLEDLFGITGTFKKLDID